MYLNPVLLFTTLRKLDLDLDCLKPVVLTLFVAQVSAYVETEVNKNGNK